MVKLYTKVGFFTVGIVLLLGGCATTREVGYLNSKIEDLQREVEAIKGKLSSEMKQDWADLETTIEDLQREIKVLRANLEEDRELIQRLTDELQGLKKGYEANISSPQEGTEGGIAATPRSTPPPTEIHPPMEEDMEGSYQKAYNAFRNGDYPQAMKMFREFLVKYPASEYADNAQYWIGECYYRQEDYERAILEYEKVIKKYPQGDKVPAALLKQGFSFLNLGDKTDAKILFQKVIKEYPRSPQAEIATKKLTLLD